MGIEPSNLAVKSSHQNDSSKSKIKFDQKKYDAKGTLREHNTYEAEGKVAEDATKLIFGKGGHKDHDRFESHHHDTLGGSGGGGGRDEDAPPLPLTVTVPAKVKVKDLETGTSSDVKTTVDQNGTRTEIKSSNEDDKFVKTTQRFDAKGNPTGSTRLDNSGLYNNVLGNETARTNVGVDRNGNVEADATVKNKNGSSTADVGYGVNQYPKGSLSVDPAGVADSDIEIGYKNGKFDGTIKLNDKKYQVVGDDILFNGSHVPEKEAAEVKEAMETAFGERSTRTVDGEVRFNIDDKGVEEVANKLDITKEAAAELLTKMNEKFTVTNGEYWVGEKNVWGTMFNQGTQYRDAFDIDKVTVEGVKLGELEPEEFQLLWKAADLGSYQDWYNKNKHWMTANKLPGIFRQVDTESRRGFDLALNTFAVPEAQENPSSDNYNKVAELLRKDLYSDRFVSNPRNFLPLLEFLGGADKDMLAGVSEAYESQYNDDFADRLHAWIKWVGYRDVPTDLFNDAKNQVETIMPENGLVNW